MPTSAPYAIPVVMNAVRQLQPQSILDIGVGFGKYGLLFREYLDLWNAEKLAETKREAWTTRIEGIEIFPDYLTPVHDFVYDKIHIGDAIDIIDGLGQYDLIFMGDVLEHFEKRRGTMLVRKLYDHADKCVLLTYPTIVDLRGGLLGNQAEAHLSTWTRDDFHEYANIAYTVVEQQADIAAIAKPPHRLPFLVGCMAARRREGWKGKLVTALVRAGGPRAASTIAGKVLGTRVALRAE